MILYREVSWWYWAVTAVLLMAGLGGHSVAFAAATVLGLIQVVHFRLREGSFTAFPVQVRVVYTGLLLLALWPSMRWLYWVPAVGTCAQVLLGYCFLARCLSLLPWNRHERLSSRLVWTTFTAPPVPGNILQGLPPTRVERT